MAPQHRQSLELKWHEIQAQGKGKLEICECLQKVFDLPYLDMHDESDDHHASDIEDGTRTTHDKLPTLGKGQRSESSIVRPPRCLELCEAEVRTLHLRKG